MSKTFPILINARLAGIGKRYWSNSEKMSERAVCRRQIGGIIRTCLSTRKFF
jgi:hypothetical protein